MKFNIKIVFIVIISVSFGLGTGYFFAPKNSQVHTSANQQIDQSTESQIYTCAMHPQIRQNEPGLCPICEMDLVPLDNNSSENPMILEMTPEAIKMANIQTTEVGQGNYSENTLRLSGKIKTDERRITSQTAHISGRIEKLFVTFTGEKITKGQVIASIYSPEFVAAQRELIEAKKLQATNPNLLIAARKKLHHWKIPDTTIDSIENSEIINSLIDIHADATGVVNNLQIAVGEHLMEGSVLFDIINLNRLWVLFDAYEEDLAHIQLGNKVSFTTPAIPDRSFSTTVSYIDPLIDPETRTASIRAEINNVSGILKPEMFVKGVLKNIKKSKKEQQLTIPKTAVLWTGKRSVVYIKIPNTAVPSFEYREIELGDAMGDKYEILSGIEPGEEVVTYGSFTIDAAAQLNNQNSMMNKMVNVKATDDDLDQDFTIDTPLKFKQQLGNLTTEYIKLKDALVASNNNSSSKAADDFLKELEKVNLNSIEGKARLFWQKQSTALKNHGANILKAQDLEAQRNQFEFLSIALINTIQAFGTDNQTFYIQHCPMAFNDRGADWIALEKEIRNPYFGSKMLKCGTVKEVLPKPVGTN